ncbi:hypothetical protein [Catalinimonas niigatensis]|uniref:hypothetical protein n=1 Tax=Catalinimonas niigatensis TaxID=1397264 RepID=UPI002665105D|nr:hypothetical protein [Catalinimonas niigatensis]WPP51306.1 hypothetical protein PZB72_02740 [Catalinimonas niigatensis]
MSKSSKKKYEELKAYYKAEAKKTEKQLHMDLVAVRHEYVPHHLKSKFLTGCAIFGSVYLAEKMIFGKRLPRIIRFTTALSSIVWAPKVYQKLHDKLTGIGELEPVEMEMIEDQQLAEDDGIAYTDEETYEEETYVVAEDAIAGLPETEETTTDKIEVDDEHKPDKGTNPT